MQSDRYNSLRSVRSTNDDHVTQNDDQGALEDALRSTLRSMRSRRAADQANNGDARSVAAGSQYGGDVCENVLNC